MTDIDKQLQFIIEIDKLKNIFRRNYIADGLRNENSAEHSWHLAMMAVILEPHSKKIDLLKVIKMVIIHDIVEVDAGDTYIHDKDGLKDKKQREIKAAKRLFGILPQHQAQELHELWDEFEEGESNEAKFANVLDRLHPFLLHIESDGKAWKENKISAHQVYDVMAPVREFPELWQYLAKQVESACEKGWLQNDEKI
ncbi:HD domain-containing protein [Candidatus Uabimicrobium amorphum]|uniref:Phosphohydrolase n=1 Tax=Uabimicrobium amorphum TaxID=2596890 RepID=A0A5S9IJW6_UABAM|nr:HD domain-containing protein [Candidatus Uabimicrobium amorphum]BBM82732.1 phosphohydrolase [Candidatus Uabimicrobium amorphum]